MNNSENKDMINFKDVEGLVEHMYEKLDIENPSSVIAEKDLIIEIMMELLRDGEAVLDMCDIDVFEYDKPYLLTLYDDSDSDYWHFSIERAYNYEKKKYVGTNGYILFHEDVKGKALTDLKNNKYAEMSDYDIFAIGESEDERLNNNTVNNADNSSIQTKNYSGAPSVQKIYYVNNKKVDEGTYKKAVESINHRENENWGYNFIDWVEFIKEASRRDRFYW